MPPLHPNPSLKQRLAALALAPSSPSSYRDAPQSPTSPTTKRAGKFFGLGGAWKRASAVRVNGNAERQREMERDREGEEEERVVARMVFQAGVDFETRPMVVLDASALPDPQGVCYDRLLARILAHLSLYVEADYTVIFFAAGGRHAPAWSWVWKAYRGLGRKYRKNLKQLYIVHSSFFTKMLFSLAGAIISPKFFRKLTYIPTLSALAAHVPITQIDIPVAVYKENLKHESCISLPPASSSSPASLEYDYTATRIFGAPLEELMGFDGEKGGVPRVVRDAVGYLRERGLEEEGLFRRSPQSAVLRAAQEAYDRGHNLSLHTFSDAHLAAVLLKKYLRDLPVPLFPEDTYPLIRRCPRPGSSGAGGDNDSVAYVRDTLLPALPGCVYILLNYILHLMHDVSLRAGTNRMDAHNLAVVLTPNLVKGSSPARDVGMCAVPGGPALFASPSPSQPPSQSQSQTQSPFQSQLQSPSQSQTQSPSQSQTLPGAERTTLGALIKLCIQRYYEVFDEVPDRSEARRVDEDANGVESEGSSLSSGSPRRREVHGKRGEAGERKENTKKVRQSWHQDDDEDIDDTMLVMPIAPMHRNTHSTQQHIGGGVPPSAWTSKPTTTSNPSITTAKPPRSLHSAYATPALSPYPTYGKGKAKSLISIEGGTVHGRKGSIAVGRGTSRKATGAGVEALGVTAAGFFTAPAGAPPVPPLL